MYNKCRDAIDEILADPDMRVRFIIGDTPARHTMKGMVGHTGMYGCEWCQGCSRTDPIRWPYQTSRGQPRRTRANVEEALRLSLRHYFFWLLQQ